MGTCTFFGHRDAPFDVTHAVLREAVVELIEKCAVSDFYVGNEGCFDRMVQTVLAGLEKKYPHIRCCIVLAYHPRGRKSEYPPPLETIYPEELTVVMPRFAIPARNRWMLDRSDYVVTCIRHSWGGAARFAAMAEARRKQIVAL